MNAEIMIYVPGASLKVGQEIATSYSDVPYVVVGYKSSNTLIARPQNRLMRILYRIKRFLS